MASPLQSQLIIFLRVVEGRFASLLDGTGALNGFEQHRDDGLGRFYNDPLLPKHHPGRFAVGSSGLLETISCNK